MVQACMMSVGKICNMAAIPIWCRCGWRAGAVGVCQRWALPARSAAAGGGADAPFAGGHAARWHRERGGVLLLAAYWWGLFPGEKGNACKAPAAMHESKFLDWQLDNKWSLVRIEPEQGSYPV